MKTRRILLAEVLPGWRARKSLPFFSIRPSLPVPGKTKKRGFLRPRVYVSGRMLAYTFAYTYVLRCTCTWCTRMFMRTWIHRCAFMHMFVHTRVFTHTRRFVREETGKSKFFLEQPSKFFHCPGPKFFGERKQISGTEKLFSQRTGLEGSGRKPGTDGAFRQKRDAQSNPDQLFDTLKIIEFQKNSG